MESYMQMLTDCAKKAAVEAAKMGTADKNRGLLAVADELTAQQDMILEENAKIFRYFFNTFRIGQILTNPELTPDLT